MSVRFQLRDCFGTLDYGLLATIVMVFPVAFELGIEVPWVVGFGGSLYCVAALLVVAFRSGREAERLAYGAPDQSLPPRDRRYWLHILASVWLVVFIKGPVVEAIAGGEVMRLVKFIALMGAVFTIAVAILYLGRSISRRVARYRRRVLRSPRPAVLEPCTSAAARRDRS